MPFLVSLHLLIMVMALWVVQGCVPTPPRSTNRPDYHAKKLMEQWRSQNHYSYYATDQDNPPVESSAPKGKIQAAYPHYVPEDDNPESYYYLVPVSRTVTIPKPPADGFNAPIFKKPSSYPNQ